MEWMEGGKWKVVTHAADQVTGYGQTRGVKRTQGSKLLGAACFPRRCDPGNLTAVRRRCVDGLVLPVYSRRICVVIEYSCP